MQCPSGNLAWGGHSCHCPQPLSGQAEEQRLVPSSVCCPNFQVYLPRGDSR